MKKTLSCCIALFALTSAQAQIFRSEAVNGAILGGIAGGVIGHNSGDLRHNGWRGAAIGAATGMLIGQAIGDANDRRSLGRYGHAHGGYVYRSAPSLHIGVGYGHYGRGHWGHRSHYGHHGHFGSHRGHWAHRGHNWHLSYVPSFGYYRGYGWGYPHIGYSDYSDYIYRTAHTPVVVQQPQVVQAPVQQTTPAPQQVTIVNNYYNTTPMSAANGLFGR